MSRSHQWRRVLAAAFGTLAQAPSRTVGVSWAHLPSRGPDLTVVLGHSPQCSGLAPAPALRSRSQQGARDRAHARPSTLPAACLSAPPLSLRPGHTAAGIRDGVSRACPPRCRLNARRQMTQKRLLAPSAGSPEWTQALRPPGPAGGWSLRPGKGRTSSFLCLCHLVLWD